MFVFGGRALGRKTDVDAWGTLEEFRELGEHVGRRNSVTHNLQSYPSRWTLLRHRPRLFIDYEAISGELLAAVETLPDCTDGEICEGFSVRLASKLTSCLIKQVAIEEVPDCNPKHVRDLQDLWPEGLQEAVEGSPEHLRFYYAFKAHLHTRYHPE